MADLQLYSVFFENGSGCLFKTQSHTYVLTAKHIFTGKQDDSEISITRNVIENETLTESIEIVKLKLGENYFPHEVADAAILIIKNISDIGSIYIQEDHHFSRDFSLCGYPGVYRDSEVGGKYVSYLISNYISNYNYKCRAQLDVCANFESINGMSGGGILKLNGDYVSIVGIQSRVPHTAYSIGEIDYVPIKHYNEIVDYPENNGKLERLLPPYLVSFSHLSNRVFNLQGVGILCTQKASKLSRILTLRSSEVITNSITPDEIKSNLSTKQLLIPNQDANVLYKKEIWCKWFELLTIINVSYGKSHSVIDLPNIVQEFRLFYSDTDEDFWVCHIKELYDFNYQGLEDNGIVVVATNRPAGDDLDILDFNKLPPELSTYMFYSEVQEKGPRIDRPMTKQRNFKYLNISAFKEYTARTIGPDFTTADDDACLLQLRGFYEHNILRR